MAALLLIKLVNWWNCSCGYNNTTSAETCVGLVSNGKGGTKTCGKLKNIA